MNEVELREILMHILNMTRKKYYTSKLQLLAFQFLLLFHLSAKQKRTKFLCSCFSGCCRWYHWRLASFTKSFFKLELKIFQDPEGRNGSLVIIGKGKIHVITNSSSFESLMVLIQMIQTRERERENVRKSERKKREAVFQPDGYLIFPLSHPGLISQCRFDSDATRCSHWSQWTKADPGPADWAHSSASSTCWRLCVHG